MQPWEHIYITSRPRRMQPAYIMAIKGDNTPSSLSMPEMATPTKQALQRPGDRWSYETHYGRGISHKDDF